MQNKTNMKKLTALLGILAIGASTLLVGCSGGEEATDVKADGRPPQAAPPPDSGKNQGGVQPPGIKEDGK